MISIMRHIPQFIKNLLLNGETVFLRFFENTSLKRYSEAENAETDKIKKHGTVISVLTPNKASVNRIPLLPSKRMIAATEKLRKNPRTADNIGSKNTPITENPRKSAINWYLKLFASDENRLSFGDVSFVNIDKKPVM